MNSVSIFSFFFWAFIFYFLIFIDNDRSDIKKIQNFMKINSSTLEFHMQIKNSRFKIRNWKVNITIFSISH